MKTGAGWMTGKNSKGLFSKKGGKGEDYGGSVSAIG
jgi:hypothetical protein